MEAVNNNSFLGAPPKSDATRGSSKLGKDEFVKLLMAQLSQQDPLSPMDSQAFVAQLAQFANVEQLQTVNAQLEALLVAQAANNQTAVSSLVGKDALFKSEAVSLAAGQPVSFQANLSQSAANVTAVITDENGRTVRTLTLGNQPAGEVDFSWDGRDDAGNPLPTGEYKVRLAAADKEGNSLDIEQRARGRVTGVSFDKGYPELIVGGLRIKLSSVIQIDEPTPTPNP